MRTRPWSPTSTRDASDARGRSYPQRRVRRRAQPSLICSALALATLAALGCGGSGGGNDPAAPEPAAATTAVDLPPGQTAVRLAWAPSEGPVTGYSVFVSRNRAPYSFHAFVAEPQTEVDGQAGETVQVAVVAVTRFRDQSEPSSPSPLIRFHAAPAEPVVARAHGGGAAVATSAPRPGPASGESDASPVVSTDVPAADASPSSGAADRQQEAPPHDLPETSDDSAPDDRAAAREAESALAPTLRRQLLAGGPRLPLSGPGAAGGHWLQERVDRFLAAGVVLIGAGERDGDQQSELVFRDAAGQLFVAEGSALVTASDPAETLEVAIRLHPTERWLALRDLDGDGVADWLLHDDATESVWLVDGATQQVVRPARPTGASSARLVGAGDFEGDGRIELLWQTEEGALAWTTVVAAEGSPSITAGALAAEGSPSITARTLAAEGSRSDSLRAPEGLILLAIADLDGDGRDDLLARDALDRILVGYANAPTESGERRLDWRASPPDAAAGLELLATLDLDGDGPVEVAWLAGDALEIWGGDRLPDEILPE